MANIQQVHAITGDFILEQHNLNMDSLKQIQKFSAVKRFKTTSTADLAHKLAATIDLDSIFTCIEDRSFLPKKTKSFKKFQRKFLLNVEEMSKNFAIDTAAVILGFEKALANFTRELKLASDDNVVLCIAPTESSKIEANKPIYLRKCQNEQYDLRRFYEKMFMVQQTNNFFDMTNPLEITIYALSKPVIGGYPEGDVVESEEEDSFIVPGKLFSFFFFLKLLYLINNLLQMMNQPNLLIIQTTNCVKTRKSNRLGATLSTVTK